MAEKGFGVKEVNLIGASGTPTITSPNNLNLNAVNVAISTNASIGGNLTVSGTVGIAGTLTYEDVTNIDSVGIVTAREGVIIPIESTLVTSSYVIVPPAEILPDTVRVPPMLTFVLIATLLAFKFKLLGLSIVGVPEAPIKLISFTPKPFSAIILFDYLCLLK